MKCFWVEIVKELQGIYILVSVILYEHWQDF